MRAGDGDEESHWNGFVAGCATDSRGAWGVKGLWKAS